MFILVGYSISYSDSAFNRFILRGNLCPINAMTCFHRTSHFQDNLQYLKALACLTFNCFLGGSLNQNSEIRVPNSLRGPVREIVIITGLEMLVKVVSFAFLWRWVQKESQLFVCDKNRVIFRLYIINTILLNRSLILNSTFLQPNYDFGCLLHGYKRDITVLLPGQRERVYRHRLLSNSKDVKGGLTKKTSDCSIEVLGETN